MQQNNNKNPDAVALGKRGGLVGGIARARALSAEQRSEIASKAACTRWKRPFLEDPYKTVLKDLRSQRDQIDRAIAVIELLRFCSSTG